MGGAERCDLPRRRDFPLERAVDRSSHEFDGVPASVTYLPQVDDALTAFPDTAEQPVAAEGLRIAWMKGLHSAKARTCLKVMVCVVWICCSYL
ncbi:hypothetical protein GCM10009550_24600 [Actinocorallia libanotica]|uniref:Uncharacterized protein n=1 Tax=Actinocorallia libanotica TaxID=46162 RepID=A0ABP4BAH8_9ACTN